MNRAGLSVIGALWVTTGVVLLVAPRTFYDVTPGVAMMGPYSVHFIRDVGLAFIASGAVTLAGARRSDRVLVLAGVAWPVLHALFHLQVWAHRGFPFDVIAAFDTVAVVLPALLAMVLAWRVPLADAAKRQELLR